MNRFFPLALVTLFFGTLTYAHEVRPALLKLTQLETEQWQLTFKQPQVQGRFLNLQVKTNCKAGDSEYDISGSALQESFLLDCANSSLEFVEIEGLQRTMIDTMVSVSSRHTETRNYIISANQPTLALSTAIPSIPAYLVLGVEHLVFGIDHVLFILALLYIVHGWKNLALVITSFTLAHSITLGLSALNVFVISQAPIEALIALSIVLLANESLTSKRSILSQRPWLIAFLFGLLHGLGFASALSQIGLPAEHTISALLLFNLGIEIGQLGIVAIALTSIYFLRQVLEKINPLIRRLPLYLTGSIASFWFIERTIQIVH